MKIATIGAGYVGLVTGTCFADMGWDVTCIDIDPKKISALEAGDIPIYEPGLEELVRRNAEAGRLHFTTEVSEGVPGCDAVFIAVGTPPRPEDGHADMKYVHAAAESIAAAMTGFTVVVNKSTVPVGTSVAVAEIMARTRDPSEFEVVSNPEFLREGAAVTDFSRPDRIVVGVRSDRGGQVMRQLYKPLTDQGYPMLVTDPESAELIKYAANAFLATKISFINEIADICERAGADVSQVANGIGLDTRIGPRFLKPGPGYGGSCFPKDTQEFVSTAREYGRPSRIVEAVVEANDARKRAMADRIEGAVDGSLDGKRVAVLGVTFKAETDDMRESPALTIIPDLQNRGATVAAYDPQGMENAASLLPDVDWAEDPYDAVKGADVLAIVTEWKVFATLDLVRVRAALKSPIVVDMRNLYDPSIMEAAGFRYVSIGRKSAV
ncbi:UDP-glucose/GDP-mannose dehydrogenase family protein [Marivibrio halodurans]|uniref:UDP-glucose 6-dehydrogenase n=1 Tax=Marivibrio halodurans TaxID=2039722 RepID=A0A8J7V342_9PROT|nr:UDP-glucose/GDP-mannose dehydrogenase family protein [Marivibrio halodurans]MBP5857831.1 UDP-glucose/GDP-mannose dehydrogenase family protein [Marivibrio halodurans]